jgi:hypothetical protein
VLPPDASLIRGLALFEFVRLESQVDDSNIGVHYSALGTPLRKAKRVTELHNLGYDQANNAVAIGYIKIEKSGEYGFSTYNFYDRNTLFVKDLEKPLCSYRDHRAEVTIDLPAGYVPLVAVSYVSARGSFMTVNWKPPGAEDYEQIPAGVFFYDRERAEALVSTPKD